MATIQISIQIETTPTFDDTANDVRNDIVGSLDRLLGFGFENVLISSSVKD